MTCPNINKSSSRGKNVLMSSFWFRVSCVLNQLLVEMKRVDILFILGPGAKFPPQLLECPTRHVKQGNVRGVTQFRLKTNFVKMNFLLVSCVPNLNQTWTNCSEVLTWTDSTFCSTCWCLPFFLVLWTLTNSWEMKTCKCPFWSLVWKTVHVNCFQIFGTLTC